LTEELEHALDRRPSVVSVGLVNTETGILADLGPVADVCAARRLILHCDAAQAFGKVPIRGAWQMLTLSAHKIGGPKGIGALVVRPGIELSPLLYGGNQQRGLRPGTEPVASIVGFARAAESASQSTDVDAIRSLRELFEQELCQRLGDVVVHGRSVDRAPHITSVAFPGTNSESFLMQLDMRGVAASAGAACTTGSIEPSHVLTAMGVSPELAKSTLRFSFGTHLQVGDVVQAATVVTEVATRLRTMHGASSG
jgi:cysteine desulfurase